MYRMKALKTFRGEVGERDHTGATRAGFEFTASSQKRVRELEIRGLAILVATVDLPPPAPRPAVVQNEAAEAGPLVESPGGETGETEQQLSSRAVPQPGSNLSKKREPAPRKQRGSRSTKAGG